MIKYMYYTKYVYTKINGDKIVILVIFMHNEAQKFYKKTKKLLAPPKLTDIMTLLTFQFIGFIMKNIVTLLIVSLLSVTSVFAANDAAKPSSSEEAQQEAK